MNIHVKTCTYFSCGGTFPDIDGPVHRYMRSSPGCWAVYGEVLAREYSDQSYFAVHRLTVDAYSVQHSGSTDRQSIQSVAVHLIRLCLFLQHGLTAKNANNAMLKAAKNKRSYTWLQPPASFGSITAADVAKTSTVDEHHAMVKTWAQHAWEAWSAHHDTINAWLPT